MATVPPPPGPGPSENGPPEAGSLVRLRRWLGRHPIVCLALLSPGIPEYLSSSSPLNALVLSPGSFLFQIAANLGLYLPGVLLVREARIRWNAGWPSVLLLGAAYGTLEEGVALSTMFNPRASVVGTLGIYGHYLGVNWVWIPGVLFVHIVLSISLPIFLLDQALPSTRGRAFLSAKRFAVVLGVLGADVTGLVVLVVFGLRFWMGWPQFVGAWAAIGAFSGLAYSAASFRWSRPPGPPRGRPIHWFFLGAAFFPGILLPESLLGALHVPPPLTIAALIAVQAALLLVLLRASGAPPERQRLLAFVAGILAPIMLVGVLAELALPLTLVADVGAILFLRYLWRHPSPLSIAPRPVSGSG